MGRKDKIMSWKQAGVNFIRMAVLLVLVSMAAFFLVSVSPLDPLTTNVGQAALGSMSSEHKDQLNVVMLDVPDSRNTGASTRRL